MPVSGKEVSCLETRHPPTRLNLGEQTIQKHDRLLVQTQCIDVFIDGFIHPPITHEDEIKARTYAIAESSAKRSELHIILDGRVIGIYSNGKEIE